MASGWVRDLGSSVINKHFQYEVYICYAESRLTPNIDQDIKRFVAVFAGSLLNCPLIKIVDFQYLGPGRSQL